jgi:hypothetical protein
MDEERGALAAPMIFLRIGWMDRYQGLTRSDTISGGGAYVAEHGFGHELFNFQEYNGTVYGYGQPPGRKERWENARINLARLGAAKDETSFSGVLAVWVATSSTGGAFVVGWYRNATVYRNWQPPPSGSGRRHSDADCGYYVTARAEDAVLLTRDERVFRIPQQEAGGFGQSNIWYADDPSNAAFRLKLQQYIQSRQLPIEAKTEGSTPQQPDPLLRQRIEEIGVKTTAAYFTGLGYRIDSVEQDNVGWDLDATLAKRKLKLEVKGLSGSQLVVELTPNEYRAMKEHRDSYRVCVVTTALTEPRLEIFAYSPDSGQWESPTRRVLNIDEIIAASCKAT